MTKRITHLLSRALTTAGVLPPGQGISDAQVEVSLGLLNDVLDQWALVDLMLYVDITTMFDLVSAKTVYTVGPGGDFDMVRPVELLSCTLRNFNDIDLGMGLVSHDTYERAVQKVTNPTQPETACYQPTFPLGTLYIWPTPAAGYRIRLTRNQAFLQVVQDDEYSFPPGYETALMYIIAARACVTWGRLQKLAEISALAEDATLLIKRKNVKKDVMRFDPALLSARQGGYSPYTDSSQ